MTDADRLEQSQWDLFWLPADAESVNRADVLATRCARPVPFLNTVVRTRSADPAALVEELTGWYGPGRGRWMVPDTLHREPLTRALAAARYSAGERFEVRALSIDDWQHPPTLQVKPVSNLATLLDCVRVAAAGFGMPPNWTEASLAADLAQCTQGSRVYRVVAYDADQAPVASGGLTAFPALGFGLLWGAATAPGARGRGAYRSVLASRIARARQLGLQAVGLYANVETSAPIVARLGFRRGGGMEFWNAP